MTTNIEDLSAKVDDHTEKLKSLTDLTNKVLQEVEKKMDRPPLPPGWKMTPEGPVGPDGQLPGPMNRPPSGNIPTHTFPRSHIDIRDPVLPIPH